MSKKIRIVEDEVDRTITIFVGRKEVGYTDYDESGWSGMDKLKSLAQNMGKALNIEVVNE